jgi:8-oxo-dGTP pyrophosphatase MutT (NUDIX family)
MLMPDLRYSFPETSVGVYAIPSSLTQFRIGKDVVGLAEATVVEALKTCDNHEWSLHLDEGYFELLGRDNAERSAIIGRTLEKWRSENSFGVLQGWRDELYSIYGTGGIELARVERAGSCLFGIITYGVHMTAYVAPTESNPLRIWVARRSATKSSYPSMLDNSVAGGITAGEEVFESIVREAAEEASLPEDLVRKYAIGTGSVSYFHIRDPRAGGESGFLHPESQYVFDLELPESQILRPCDGEVGSFELWEVSKIQEAIAKDEFKPNCAVVIIVSPNFFINV